MRICTNCGRILDDDEEICRVCNSDLILDTGNSEDETPGSDTISEIQNDESISGMSDSDSPEVEDFSFSEIASKQDSDSAVISDAVSEEPTEGINDQTDVQAPDEFSITVAPEATDIEESLRSEELPPEEVLSIGSTEDDQPSSDEQSSEEKNSLEETDSELPVTTDTSQKEQRPDKIKIISVKVPNDERLPHVNRSRVILVVSALLALSAVILAVFMVVIPLVDARKQDEAARISAYMQYLEGQWLSETFIYSGQEFPSCEILTLNKNNTFTAEIWTSPNDRETYDPETWTVTARQTGQFRLELDSSSLRVSYEDENGNTMVYRRYILKLDTASLVLREYYNEKMTEYFDVVFSRYSSGE